VNRKLGFGLAFGALAVLLAAWFFVNRQVDRLDEALARRLERVENLDGLVGDANSRIEESYRRMEQARARREAALDQLEEAESGAAAAAEELQEVETLTAEAEEMQRKAREAAAEARRRERAERRKREEEWARLERALGQVAPTIRYGWSLMVEPPENVVEDKERISRLAGVLLAHHGYRVTIGGEGAAAVEEYLRKAGIPAEVMRRGAASGGLLLRIEDQILAPREN